MGAKAVDIVGERFGRLVVLAKSASRRVANGTIGRSLCKCDCGVTKIIDNHNLRGGRSTSCGCGTLEASRRACRTHGHTSHHKTSRVYRTWQGIKDRCTNKAKRSYARYGGRGIVVCDRWSESFESFLADMGMPPSESHSIDRIDNDSNYEPGNCRWATSKEQMNNFSRNRWLTIDGEKSTIAQWSERSGIKPLVILKRIQRGWSHEDAVYTPLLRSQEASC